jgi:uncharacterized membrane protein
MYILSSLVFLLLDFTWIYTNINIYNKLVYSIQGETIHFNLEKAKALVITYIFLLYGLNYIAIPYNIPIQLGLVVYGLYSYTNLTLFKNYPIHLAAIDTLWGPIIYYIATKFKY